ncbi:interferon-inducible GTPase 5-like [Stylophora pistillata]|uniref:Interferon-inducible GTPase 5 n=1 Tax=Stylophora pistillata TaxID=50429 RepID=A0A2B4SJ43_STYPI|nr:interferon-inducible GTPase 5-like [Stylophora pistillata]PFX28465.1 Interferon-inducible GTPase 5 [Stylophora pistillata]
MADFYDPMSDWEEINAEDVKEYMDENGVSGLAEFFKGRMERWKKVEVNIGITGDSGAGKSSFINAIRELDDDANGAAPVDVTECTIEPTSFNHPKYPNIKFWDLPGIGTPNYPDVETYRDKVQLDKYHTFLIFASSRFTENDIILAKEIKKQGKSFFFIRTKIDDNVRAEKRKKSFSEAAMLEKIRRNCIKNLVDEDGKPICIEDHIFLISNHHPGKWDFGRLTQAILDALPRYQRETLTLSLNALTSLSKDILKRKVEFLEGRMMYVAGASALAAAIPVLGLSFAVDSALLLKEIREYITQLGIPEKGSNRFGRLSSTTQQEILDLYLKFATVSGIASLFAIEAAAEGVAEEFARFIPFVGSFIASGLSFGGTYILLRHSLKRIEAVALAVLEEAAQQSVDDLDLE